MSGPKEPSDRYAKISRRLYVDRRFRALSKPQPNAQTLFLYLLVRPANTSLPGLFAVGEAALAEELGWPIAGFRRAFAELEAAEMAKADWDARLVWIPNAIRHNAPANANVIKGWKLHLAVVPECALKDEALDAMERFLESLPSWALGAFRNATGNRSANGSGNGFGNRSGNDSADRSENGTRNQDQEQEQEQKQEQEQSDARATPATPGRSAPAPLAALASRGQPVRGVGVAPELGLMPEPAPRADDAPETRDLREVLELFEQAWSATGRPRLGLTVNAQWERAASVWRWACKTRPEAPHELVREAVECACASEKFLTLGSPWAAFASAPGRNLRGPAKTQPVLTPTTDAEWEAQLSRFQKRDAS